jgi:hypothetical protein
MTSHTITLVRRLLNAGKYVLFGGVMPAEQPKAGTRVGLLNTGELIVLFAHGGHMVLSAATTDLVRDALDQDPFSASLLPHHIGGAHVGVDHAIGSPNVALCKTGPA